MALQIDYQISVDLKKTSNTSAFAVQGDEKSRRLIISVLSDEVEMDISDCTAQLKCSFKDETVDISACEINDNRVIAPLTNAMLAHSGQHKLQLTLFDSSGAVISSSIIRMFVDESIADGETVNTPEFSAINAMSAKIEETLGKQELIENKLVENTKAIDDLQLSAENTDEDISALTMTVNNSCERLTAAEEDVSELNEKIEDLQNNTDKAISGLASTVEDSGERLNTAETAIENINAKIDMVSGDVEEIKNDINSINLSSERIKKYSVSFSGSNCAGTRLDSAVGMRAEVQIGEDGSAVINDFDNVSFFNRPVCCCTWDKENRKWRVNAYEGEPGFARDGSNGEVMYECTPFYYNADFSGEGAPHYVSVTGTPCEGYTLAPMFKNGYDKVYCPSYWMSMVDGVAASRSGTYSHSGSLNLLMTNARTFDDKAHLETIEILFCDYILLLVEFATKDLQNVMLGACEMRTAQDDKITDIISTTQFRLENVNIGEYVVGQTICIGSVKNSDNRISNVRITAINGGGTVQNIQIDKPVLNMAIGDYISSRPWINGETDSITASSGTLVNDGKHPCIWRGKVDPWGEVFSTICNILIRQYGVGTEEDPYSYILQYLPAPEKYNSGAITKDYIEANYLLANEDGYAKTISTDSRYPFLLGVSEVGATAYSYAAAHYDYPRCEISAVRAGGYISTGWRWCSPVNFYCYNPPSAAYWTYRARLNVTI